MMKRLFRLKGLSFWLLGAAVGLNFFWSLMLVMAAYLFITQDQSRSDLIQIGMLLASFLGPFIIGWIVAKMAADLHGPSYGLIGSFGGLVPIVIALVPTGIFGILIAFTTILGGLNGGTLAMRNLNRTG